MTPTGHLGGREERFEHLVHFRQLIVRLESAWIGKEPKKSAAEAFGLRTDHGSGSAKGRPVRLQPEYRDTAGPQSLYLCLEQRCSFTQFRGREFAGGGCHPRHQVRDPYAEPRQSVLLRG